MKVIGMTTVNLKAGFWPASAFEMQPTADHDSHVRQDDSAFSGSPVVAMKGVVVKVHKPWSCVAATLGQIVWRAHWISNSVIIEQFDSIQTHDLRCFLRCLMTYSCYCLATHWSF